MSELFARVRAMVGDVLPARRVAVMGSPDAGVLVAYLAACGVQQWVGLAHEQWLAAEVGRVKARFGPHVSCRVECVLSPAEVKADVAVVVDDWVLACALPTTIPRLAVMTPRDGGECRVWLALAGEALPAAEIGRKAGGEVTGIAESASHFFDWRCAAPLVALWARALLLRGTVYAMATWDAAVARGVRGFGVGGVDDPTRARWLDGPDFDVSATGYRAPMVRRGTLLVAGLGSLGSVAAAALAPSVERLVLVDPDRVEVANLVRQAYRADQVGMAKTEALAGRLGERGGAGDGYAPEVVAVVDTLIDDEQVADLIGAYGVTGVLVTTGTQADFAIARAAYATGVPHVVGRCYARARYWEGVVVDGATVEGRVGPSYAEVRGHVALGPLPTPTPEEQAAYGAPEGLVAEPATAMETGWAALWLARLMGQMMLPATLREGWLLARLAAGASCFVGGLVVETGNGGAAYGVCVPGEVHAWSMGEIEARPVT